MTVEDQKIELNDVTGAEEVEVVLDNNRVNGKVLWVNVDGVCVLRVCRIKGDVTIETSATKLKKEIF